MTRPIHAITESLKLLLLSTCVLLSSCAEFRQVIGTTMPATRPPLDYFAWLESADQAALDNEHSRLSAAAGNRNSRIHLIQRALLYSVPSTADTSGTDTAIELLTVALQEGSGDSHASALQEEYTAFAGIWLKLLEQQRNYRLARENQLSDKDMIRDLSVQVDRLEKQIDALTTIEQRLIQREQEQAQP